MRRKYLLRLPFVSPIPDSVTLGSAWQETLSTLRFAQRAKEIQNVVRVNKETSIEDLQETIRLLEAECKRLREEKNRSPRNSPLSPTGEGLPVHDGSGCFHCEGCDLADRFDCGEALASIARLEEDLSATQALLEEAIESQMELEEELEAQRQKGPKPAPKWDAEKMKWDPPLDELESELQDALRKAPSTPMTHCGPYPRPDW